MSTPSIAVDPDLARQALGDALDADAAAQPAAEAPPRRQPPPDATPEAPWGFKADGTPRKGPPGPGRPRRSDPDSRPRTQPDTPDSPSSSTPSSSSAAADAAPVDYTEDIGSALVLGWMCLSTIPFTHAHAAIVRRSMPELAPAWNTAAQQNATVRRYVRKLSGDGSWSWVIPVTVATTPLVLGLFQASINSELRAELKQENARNWEQFLRDQVQAAAELEAAQSDTPPSAPSDGSPMTSSPNGSPSSGPPDRGELEL